MPGYHARGGFHLPEIEMKVGKTGELLVRVLEEVVRNVRGGSVVLKIELDDTRED